MSAQWRNRIVGYADVEPRTLKPNLKNWRLHPKAQKAALAGVLGQVGVVQNVLVNRTTGRMLDGHLRVSMALTENQPSIPVTYVELTEAEEKLVLASLDSIGSLAVAYTGAGSQMTHYAALFER